MYKNLTFKNFNTAVVYVVLNYGEMVMRKDDKKIRCCISASVTVEDLKSLRESILKYAPQETISSVLCAGLELLFRIGFERLAELNFFEPDGCAKLAQRLSNPATLPSEIDK